MRYLITGGAGFIGSHFVRFVLDGYSDASVVILDALTYAATRTTIADCERDKRCRFIHGSICDRTLVDDLMAKTDIVVHFAAESHVDRSIKNSRIFLDTNIIGTHTLLESARTHGGVRFHHVSTDEVYGSLAADDAPFTEYSPYDPRSPYAASKASSDHLVRAYFHTYQLPITISNCSNNYGPYQFPEKLIPLAVARLFDGKKVPVYGDGLNIRDWLFVADHCRAIDRIIQKGKIGETYCIGGKSEVTNKALVEMLCALCGYAPDMIEFVADRAGHDRRYAIDFSKMTTELGWAPTTSLTKGLTATVARYKENRAWWEPLLYRAAV